MNCDVILPKDGERWGSIDVDADRCAPCKSMIRRIFIAICHVRPIAGAAAVNRRVAGSSPAGRAPIFSTNFLSESANSDVSARADLLSPGGSVGPIYVNV